MNFSLSIDAKVVNIFPFPFYIWKWCKLIADGLSFVAFFW